MKIIEPLIFATIASIGNTMFALGQKIIVDLEYYFNNCYNTFFQ